MHAAGAIGGAGGVLRLDQLSVDAFAGSGANSTWTRTLKDGTRHVYRPVYAVGADLIYRWGLQQVIDTKDPVLSKAPKPDVFVDDVRIEAWRNVVDWDRVAERYQAAAAEREFLAFRRGLAPQVIGEYTWAQDRWFNGAKQDANS